MSGVFGNCSPPCTASFTRISTTAVQSPTGVRRRGWAPVKDAFLSRD
jgi:hypothetical protein